MKNPIFVEYYLHEQCECYKVLNPWTEYREEKLVLCRVNEGLTKAKQTAMSVLVRKLYKALNAKIEVK